MRELDEANGLVHAQAAPDDLTDNGVVEIDRTGVVHHHVKQDIVRQWLDRASPPDSHTLHGRSQCSLMHSFVLLLEGGFLVISCTCSAMRVTCIYRARLTSVVSDCGMLFAFEAVLL